MKIYLSIYESIYIVVNNCIWKFDKETFYLPRVELVNDTLEPDHREQS